MSQFESKLTDQEYNELLARFTAAALTGLTTRDNVGTLHNDVPREALTCAAATMKEFEQQMRQTPSVYEKRGIQSVG